MATINYEFYDKKDKYSDGDIENKIIEYIKKYPDDYEEAFKEDDSWPVFYHLSNARSNVINWYPFKENASILEVGAGMGAITSYLCENLKKVTSIELSKRRATAIYERNKKKENLEIIVGNFKNIKLKEKYDYILLNGVLEYGALYMDTENPYVDFLMKLKKNLKPDGKILIAIENKFGLKYWCGAIEDHTGLMFDGINNYISSNGIKTFSKEELEKISYKCNMSANFYYMFPDYKFPQVVYTDKAINKGIKSDYLQYYCNNMNFIALEKELYKEIYNQIPFFANSYFVELSNEKTEVEVEFVKYNYYRNKKYNLVTYLKKDKFYKKNLYKDGTKHINDIIEIAKSLENKDVIIEKVYREDESVYSNNVNEQNLMDIVNDLLEDKKYTEVEKIISNIYDLLLKISDDESSDNTTIFDKYNIKLSDNQKSKYKYYKHGYLDVILSNIFLKNDKFILIDQEWYDNNVPIEYIIYRNISAIPPYNEKVISLKEKLYKKYNIDIKLFNKCEEKFQNQIMENNIFYEYYLKYSNNINFIHNLKEWINRKNELEESIIKLSNDYNEVVSKCSNIEKEYQNILNSKGWKILSKFRRIIKKIRGK